MNVLQQIYAALLAQRQQQAPQQQHRMGVNGTLPQRSTQPVVKTMPVTSVRG